MSTQIQAGLSFERVFSDLTLIRQQRPLIHNITNLVAMQLTANILLAIGASPMMAHAEEELADILRLARVLLMNMGTLDAAWIRSMESAQRIARQRALPIVFDPVGAGASQYRTHFALRILEQGVSILRGNASEILALAGADAVTKGVDAHHRSQEALDAAKYLARHYQCVVAVSGETDIIVNQHHLCYVPYGTFLFTRLTGMGCSAAAVMSAFAAVNQDYFAAAQHGVVFFTLAGQLVAAQHDAARDHLGSQHMGPGSFQVKLLDMLAALKLSDVEAVQLDVAYKNSE